MCGKGREEERRYPLASSVDPRRAENVEAGHSELLKYYESVSKHRSFILKMLGSMVALVLMVALVARLWKAPETLPGPGPGPTVT